LNPHSNGAEHPFRVRYAECTAHGELALAGYLNFFSEAAARALQGHDLDLRALTARGGALRESGYEVSIQSSPAYDDVVTVGVGLQALDEGGFTLGFELHAAGSGKPLASGLIRYGARAAGAGGAPHLPAEIRARLQAWTPGS
jgi:acyl-CoA thioesterase FadM